MPREKELFRDNLERLDKAFPDKEMLSLVEAGVYLGVKDRRTVGRLLKADVRQRFISKCALARAIS